MPSIELKTNFHLSDPKEFALGFSKEMATILGKPESYISVHHTYNDTLTFGGTLEPAFLVSITSLGNLSPEKNEEYSAKITAYLSKLFGLSSDRGYITFWDPGNSYIGYQGTTFGTIFGGK